MSRIWGWDHDAAGNFGTITRIVTVGTGVPDTQAPVVTVTANGTANSGDTLVVGGSWVDAGSTVTDNRTQGIVAVVTSTVDTATAGTYTITYTATDAAGNVGTNTRTVTVNAAPVPPVTP